MIKVNDVIKYSSQGRLKWGVVTCVLTINESGNTECIGKHLYWVQPLEGEKLKEDILEDDVKELYTIKNIH